MIEACYLLDMRQGQTMKEKMEVLLDQERLLKYQELKSEQTKLLSLGAGALLRMAWTEGELALMQEEGHPLPSGEMVPKITTLSDGEELILMSPEQVCERLEELPEVEEPRYWIGEHGKPYFRGSKLCFSLSHSKSMVMCAIADHEIGVDVQCVTQVNWERLAVRYYSKDEQDYLMFLAKEDAQRARHEFFRLWCRKEAFGKMTGEGAAPYLGTSFLEKQEGYRIRDGVISLGDDLYCNCICEVWDIYQKRGRK